MRAVYEANATDARSPPYPSTHSDNTPLRGSVMLLTSSTDTARFLRFLVVGVVNTLVHYAVYLPLWFALPYLGAHLIAVTVATSCSYLLNCHFTFRTQPTLRTFLLYPLSNVTNIVLSTVLVYLIVEALLIDSRIATLLGGVLVVPATFIVSKLILSPTGENRMIGVRE